MTGRPSGYKPEFAGQAEKLCALGATDADLADFFEVSIRTIERWRVQFPEFCRAVKDAKEEANARVERSLYQRALGYSHDAVKIMTRSVGNGESVIEQVPFREHFPPDTTAAIFWLKNRRPEQWRDKQDHTLANADGSNIETSSPDKLAHALLNLLHTAKTEG